MADWNSLTIQGTIASEPTYKDGNASFRIDYKNEYSDAQYILITNNSNLINKAIKKYIHKANIGKRIVIKGELWAGSNTIIVARIHFIDSLISVENAASINRMEPDFDE